MDAIISKPMGIDVLSSLQQWQALKQAQTNQALTQQQVVGAGQQNQLGALNLARTGYLYGLAGVPGAGAQPAATSAPGGTPSPLGALAVQQPTQQLGAAAPQAVDSGAAPASYPGQLGVDRVGVPLPLLTATNIVANGNKPGDIKDAIESGRQAIFRTVASAQPQDFPTAMASLFNQGWITPQMYQDAIAHPDGRARILQATMTPEAYQGAMTAALGKGMQYDPATGHPMVSPTAVAATGATAQAEAGGKSAGDLPLAGALAAARAQGGATAETVPITQPATNPDGTPQLNKDGSPVLTTTYVNKATLAQRSRAAPVGGGTPTGDGIANNPLLGNIPPNMLPASGTPQSAAPAAAPAPAVLPGVGTGQIVQTPQQAAALDVQKTTQAAQNTNDIAAMGAHRTELANTAQSAVQNNSLLDQMRVEGQGFDHGSFTNAYQQMSKDFGSVAQALGGKMPPNVGNWEDFQKNAGALARTAASALSPKVGVQELELVQKYLPSATMSSQGFNRIADQTQGLNDYQIARNAAAANFTGRPAQFESQFNANVTPGVFIVHRMSVPDAATFAHEVTATPAGKQVWARIMSGAQYAQQHGLFDAIGGD
jgi:hypothetical protein